MEKLLEIYNELAEEGVFLSSGCYHLQGDCDSVIIEKEGRYGIFLDIDKIRTVVQEKEAVVHEWAHMKTGTTYSLNASPVVKAKAERRADIFTVKKLVPKDELDAAVADGRTEIWELAEHFNVSCFFMQTAVRYYKSL